jgi:putative flippase GtrA
MSPSRKTVVQFLAYLVIGGLSFLVELGSFELSLVAALPLPLASVLSFVLADVANYFLCIRLAFVAGRFSLQKEILRLAGIVLVGLSLNTAMVVLLSLRFGVAPVGAKVLTLPIVLIWSFLGRKFLVFHLDKVPEIVQAAANTVEGRSRSTAPGSPAAREPPVRGRRRARPSAPTWSRARSTARSAS